MARRLEGWPAMRKLVLFAACFASTLCWAGEIRITSDKTVMFSDKTILSNVINSRDFTVLMKAIKSVKLEYALMRPGAFTLFAPDNTAFSKLPADISEDLFKRVNRDEMAKVLACHIIAGTALAGANLHDRVADGTSVEIETLGGCILTVSNKAGTLFVSDESGHQARITEQDITQANGMIEMIDRVLLPNT